MTITQQRESATGSRPYRASPHRSAPYTRCGPSAHFDHFSHGRVRGVFTARYVTYAPRNVVSIQATNDLRRSRCIHSGITPYPGNANMHVSTAPSFGGVHRLEVQTLVPARKVCEHCQGVVARRWQTRDAEMPFGFKAAGRNKRRSIATSWVNMAR